eukprot:6051428-Pleurochrysis_carterae.AAC.4
MNKKSLLRRDRISQASLILSFVDACRRIGARCISSMRSDKLEESTLKGMRCLVLARVYLCGRTNL